jgi:Flp pilus assembly protein TadG
MWQAFRSAPDESGHAVPSGDSPMIKFANLKSSAAAFVEDRGGNFAIMFAIAAVPVLMSVGIAVDYTRMLNAKSDMQNALDVALISTAKDIAQGKIKPSDAKAAVQTFFELNLNANRYDAVTTTITNFKFDPATIKVSADVQTDLALVFPVFGMGKTAKVTTASSASYVERKVEVSMVLDVTGSMGDKIKSTGSTKIIDLKAATNDAIDAFLDNNAGKTRVAIVPYSAGVNSGSFVSAVRDPAGGMPVDACANERRGVHMFDDVSPSVAKVTRANEMKTKAWFICPTTPVQPLTDNKVVLKTLVSTLSANGSTAGHMGIQWGQYMLSPKWKSLMPAKAEPTNYHTPHTDKVMIVMTDGLFNTEFSKAASLPNVAGVAQPSGRLAIGYCDNLKANGVKVYTIGFDLDGISAKPDRDEATATLTTCASSPANFFKADNGAQLTAAFKEIAKRVEVVALTN